MVVGIVIAVMWIGSGLPVDHRIVVVFSLLLAATILLLNTFFGFYDRIHSHTVHQTRARAVLAVHLALPIAYGLYSLLPLGKPNLQFFELTGMGAATGMLLNRMRSYHAPPVKTSISRVLIFGAGPRAKDTWEILKKTDRTVLSIGFYPSPHDTSVEVPANSLLPTSKSLRDTALALEADEIVVAVEERRGGAMPLRELLDCKLYGIKVLDLATHFEQTLGQIRLDSLKASFFIFGDGFRQNALRNFVKTVFDICGAIALLLISFPFMIVTAILIVAESGFPIFYSQERIGLGGKPFKITKFRSMRTDAEKDGKPRWATKSDDRVTRVGRLIRKTRIDELPQLFAVLKGNMSLVGPRPERQFFVDQLAQQVPFYAVRHSVKPGVTGWAQVRFHYGASMEDAAQKLQFDLYYVKNHTFFLDVVILLETVGVVLSAKGAQ